MSFEAAAWAIRQTTKLPTEKLILIALADCHNRDTGRCDPSLATLAEIGLCSQRTAMRAIESLQDQGLIVAHKRAGKRTRFALSITKTPDTHVTPDKLSPVTPVTKTPDTHVTPPLTPMSPEPVSTRKEPVIKYSPDDKRLAEYIYQRVLIVAPKAKAPNIGKWASVIRLMRERDNLNYREIAEVFTWANSHHFWQTNILSPEKLRNQFATLHAQKEGENENTQNPINRKLSAVDEVRAAIRKREESRAAASRDHGAVMAETIGDVRESLYKPVRGRANGELGEAIEGDYTRPDSDGPKPPNELDF